ncbi:GGDEF domain-containing protein [Gallaecimonas mangrovi]|uniref:GGDEF domain-containing protein n=1 Tax=Gallaecimonas mangrovi TaxID=2291597 RepID=UPI00186666FC|nr:GGDEF domain-containing protein [Gallaecimonas mangrovi]
MAQHKYKLLLSVALLVALLILALNMGTPKPLAIINWLDAVGEGCVLLVSLAWVGMVLKSRPHGRVTLLLFAGGLMFCCSSWLDWLDEFIHYPGTHHLMSWTESLPAPVGLAMLTFGLLGWHREQLAITAQLKSREHFFREHQLVDSLTRLYTQPYLQLVLERELHLHQQAASPLTLLAWDIRDFGRFNLQQGELAGDRVLKSLAEFLVAGLRSQDLLCRLGGDRFVALLPASNQAQAQALASALAQQLAERPWLSSRVQLKATILAAAPGESSDALLARLQQQLDKDKGRGPFVRPA